MKSALALATPAIPAMVVASTLAHINRVCIDPIWTLPFTCFAQASPAG